MITKYMLSGQEIITIQIDFEDMFKIVYYRTDTSGKWTIYKNKTAYELFPIFDSIDELIEYRVNKVEKQVIDLQLKLKTICEKHAEFLKQYKQ